MKSLLALNIVIILLIGSAGKSGDLYMDGLQGIQQQPLINLGLIVGAAIVLNRSLGLMTWALAAAAVFIFSRISYDAIIGSTLYNSVLPQLVGIICIILAAKLYEPIQLRAMPGKLISLPALITYGLLLVALAATCIISL